ncbi:MAG: hypothetical protein KGL39_45785 [Patescibacteria group bacterium]|nr:hypothetical protein [Patescibacteria group bacterium]
MIQLVATGVLNYLTQTDSSFEAGIGSWAGTNTSLSQSTAHVDDGSYSLLSTPAGAGATTAYTQQYAVLGNTQYTGIISDYAGLAASSVTCSIEWYSDTAGTVLISTSAGTPVTDSTSAWTQATVTAIAPSNAVSARLMFSYTASGVTDLKYLDECGLFLGTNTAWSIGCLGGSATATILRSDGLYVRNASASNVASLGLDQTITVNDYEVAPGTTYTYQLQITGAGTSTSLVSPLSIGASASIATGRSLNAGAA